MSAWTRTLIYLGLREEPDDVDWEVVEDAAVADVPRVTPTTPPSTPSRSEAPSNVRPLRGGIDVSADRVTVVQVRVFDDVETIGARYRHRQAVLFDVSACPREVARRTVDFVSGLTYASRGTLRRTAPRAFLLVPEGVDISLDERRRLSQLGYDVEGAVR
jgi:cell division inhibitor SepF